MKKILDKISKLNSTIKVLIFSGVLILGSIVVTVFKNSVAMDTSLLRNQTVEGISFENAKLDIDSGITTLTADIINNNLETYNLNYISIVVEDKNHDSDVLIGYIGNSINVNEKKILTARIDKDLSEAVNITYSIIK